ncbi:hypothetical protein Tco_0303661 [Tanacetum coccineum]
MSYASEEHTTNPRHMMTSYFMRVTDLSYITNDICHYIDFNRNSSSSLSHVSERSYRYQLHIDYTTHVLSMFHKATICNDIRLTEFPMRSPLAENVEVLWLGLALLCDNLGDSTFFSFYCIMCSFMEQINDMSSEC